MSDFGYTAYGMHIRSEIALPYFRPAAAADAPDVTVRLGAVPAALPAPAREFGLWQAAPGVFLLNLEGVARYRVRGGREIAIEPLGEAGDAMVTVLLGSVWTALLQQRGLLTLHASAVEAMAGAVLFLGRSGSGKSTLAAALAAREHAVLADDVAAVRNGGGGSPVVVPGYPNLRLWEDSLDRLGRLDGALRRVRPDLAKYLLPQRRFIGGPQPLRAAYVLTARKQDTVELLARPRAEALMWLKKNTHRGKFVDGFGLRRAHFRAVARIARQIPVVRVIRPAQAFRIDALADCIERDLPQRCGG